MTFIVRPATERDLKPLYEMAKLTGGGFTNLPPDRPALKAKLERSRVAFARDEAQITLRRIADNRTIIYALVLIALMLLRPQGLFGGIRAFGGGATRKIPGKA